MARWQSCNVLQVGKEGREVWQFAGSNKFNLLRRVSTLPNEPLPSKLVSKDWQTLLQPRLDVAWLPANHVFLRAVQLPKSDVPETRAMLELQLEKLSPLPVAQIEWSFSILPQPGDEMQTVVLIIVPRVIVDDFLGKIEGRGYLADRLELPLLDQLRATKITADGVWLYPGIGPEKDHCLMAWWFGGILQHLALVYLSEPVLRAALLREQLAQTGWAGEIEGWLKGAPRLHVVADPATADPWLLEFIQTENAVLYPPCPATELAAHTARRVTRNEVHTNLLPPEYSKRYKEQFVDRIWMRSLGALLLLYLLGIGVYFGWTEFARWQLGDLRSEVAQLSGSYTNAQRLAEHVRVLQEQVDLQFAALECWKAVAQNLPAGLILDSLQFDHGKKLIITGSASNEDVSKVQDFNEAMRAVQFDALPLFAEVEAPKISPMGAPNRIRWVFPCNLRKTDIE